MWAFSKGLWTGNLQRQRLADRRREARTRLATLRQRLRQCPDLLRRRSVLKLHRTQPLDLRLVIEDPCRSLVGCARSSAASSRRGLHASSGRSSVIPTARQTIAPARTGRARSAVGVGQNWPALLGQNSIAEPIANTVRYTQLAPGRLGAVRVR